MKTNSHVSHLKTIEGKKYILDVGIELASSRCLRFERYTALHCTCGNQVILVLLLSLSLSLSFSALLFFFLLFSSKSRRRRKRRRESKRATLERRRREREKKKKKREREGMWWARYLTSALSRSVERATAAPLGRPSSSSSPSSSLNPLFFGVLESIGACTLSRQQQRGFAAMKVYKPTSPGQRHRVTVKRDHLWKGKPFRALTRGKRSTGGRNNQGRITAFHRGGGHKRRHRLVDLWRSLHGAEGIVKRLEYDPNRSADIALVEYVDQAMGSIDNPYVVKRHAYIIAPEGLKPGDTVVSNKPGAAVMPGNAFKLRDIPVGVEIHNIELTPGKGGQLVRSAGTFATMMRREAEDGYCIVKLPSGEQRYVRGECMATVGSVGNKDHHNRKLGKAGANRWRGRRPVVRGVAMNPVDHPHGGGEGKSSGGRPSSTPWGKPTKGYRTRKKKKDSNKFIHLSRHNAKRKRKR